MRKEAIILALALVILLKPVLANSAPLISDLDSEILVCESSNFSLSFNVAELDGDSLTVGISPSGPFFVRPISSETPITKVELFSDNLTKIFSNKVYSHTIFVTDGELVDTKNINITVIEANNPPNMEHLSVETIDLNKTEKFRKEVKLTDQESGNPAQGQFLFTISDDLNLLDMTIDNKGIINYNASESHLGIHEVTVCATDSGIGNLKDKIGVCTPDKVESTTCEKFQLAIVKGNSPPTILTYNSSNSSSRIAGTQKIAFQIFKYDPEKNYPDTYWYVDNKLKQIGSEKSSDKFVYSFGCDIWGKHKIRAVITDGLLNDSVDWVFDVVSVACPEGIVSRETIGGASCEEKWGCLDWGLCQNALQSKEAGNLGILDYENLKQKCSAKGLNENTCGYQIRNCLDVNNCNTLEKKPLSLLPCYFSLEPSCSDGIKNCHDSKCEFLTDCGGPCSPCPTCSDRTKNQGEEKTDCGGPCPEQCGAIISKNTEENILVKQSTLFAIIVALVLAAIQIFRIIRSKHHLDKKTKKELVLTYE
jgi:hypothetical protein